MPAPTSKSPGPLIFLSHASEDKDFARQLKDSLGARYSVWWDEDIIAAGDSLWVTINAGMAACQFGVILLSSAYLRKKWTQAELAGLFSLESTTRKVLIPLWHGVTRDEVEGVFPILADRWAPSTDKGIAWVAEAVITAIEAATKQRDLTARPTLVSKLLAADAVARKKAFSARLLQSPEGVKAVEHEFQTLLGQICAIADEVSAQSREIEFKHLRHRNYKTDGMMLEVQTAPDLSLVVELSQMHVRNASSALLVATVYKRKSIYSGGLAKLAEQKFGPIFEEDGSLRWRGSREALPSPEAAEQCLELLHEARARETA